jgi:hypothetical protein
MTSTGYRYTSTRCPLLFHGIDCIGIFLETDPILSTFRSLDAGVNSIANITCPVNEQVGHLRVAPEGHDIVANSIDKVLDGLGSRINLVGEPGNVHEQRRRHSSDAPRRGQHGAIGGHDGVQRLRVVGRRGWRRDHLTILMGKVVWFEWEMRMVFLLRRGKLIKIKCHAQRAAEVTAANSNGDWSELEMVTLICTCLPSSRHIIEGSATIIRNAEEGRTAISPDLRQFSSMIPTSSPRSEVTGVVVHILFDKRRFGAVLWRKGTHPWKIPLRLISVG